MRLSLSKGSDNTGFIYKHKSTASRNAILMALPLWESYYFSPSRLLCILTHF
ncbi:uncharacterized protein ASCRUDRAFT_79735 [Ascoidea rubescens DSM 1968]|uniref:Uncharacterized protein n=1 Tax=Ascoidea rubescens DSM 1968 TaxID=1344418 RepID=A0A1D2VNL9_9ASCO|nr:hypothetical protein ASCRUDRAFT_79735 [Ascoidea rubescens DSM 1968]ODV63200.1 hypothetical protein ASCRUDRAFT_79735 [Ascoidea rubescens DSM 1968]